MWPSTSTGESPGSAGNSPVIHGGNSAYGAGAIAAPLLVSSYVFGEANWTTIYRSDSETGSRVALDADYRISSLSAPFAVAGALQAIVPCLFLVLYCFRRFRYPDGLLNTFTKTNKNSTITKSSPYHLVENLDDLSENDTDEDLTFEKVNLDDNKEKDQNPKPQNRNRIAHRRTKIYLCGFMLSCYATARIGHFNFSTALLQHLPGLSVDAGTAAHVLSVLSAAYMTGRIASALISFKLSPDTLLSAHLVILITAISVLTFGRDDLGKITFGTALLGYGFSAMWASCFAFTARHLVLTASVCSLYTLLSGSLSLVVPLVMGRSFESNPVLFFYMEYAFIVCCALLFITLKVWIASEEGGDKRVWWLRWLWRSKGQIGVKYSYVQ